MKFLSFLLILINVNLFAFVHTKEIFENNDTYKINIEYPATEISWIDEKITKFIEKELSDFKKEVKNREREEIKWKYVLFIAYEKYQVKPFLSFKFTIYEFLGGAHGMTFIKTFVFDKKGKRTLKLSNIFEEENFLKNIKKEVRKQLLEKIKGNKEWIIRGTEKLKDFENFVLTKDKIIFFFPPYQVACYAAGIQKAEILYKKIGRLKLKFIHTQL